MDDKTTQASGFSDNWAARQAIAEAQLGHVRWSGDSKGFCTCPGATGHTSATGRTDTIIYLDGAPTIFCMHQSCTEQVAAANRELRRAIHDGDPDAAVADQAERLRYEAMAQQRERLERRAKSSFSSILRQFPWSVEQMQADSKVDLNTVAFADQPRLLLQLFQAEDVVWIGERTDSGSPAKAHHFRTAREWLADPAPPPGELICPAAFKSGTYARKNEQVATRRILVIESDVLPKDEVGAIFRWLRDAVELPLAAVIDTGGKSLHAWFEFPPKAWFEDLAIILPALGCDPGMFRPSQPARLPGVIRAATLRQQKLVYFGKEVSA